VSQTSPNPEKIRSMFAKVAGRYDRANTVLSMGVHHLWRKKLVQLSGAVRGQNILDCATGTGDLALEFKKAVGPEGRVIGTDFCAEMMIPAPAKARSANLDIEFKQADVMALPFADGEFDISSISFGIRNVADPKKALMELSRVVKPGGMVMILEFGQVDVPGFAQIYNFYSSTVLPWVGGLVTGQREAYQYLQTSSAHFPCRQEFLDLMNSTGKFESTSCHSLTGGIAYIYKGLVRSTSELS
jgi:demethylmenaquinone methyltransferase/2-methoxy-6-polyprenyl-1,4-benzoquinol methylase